MFKKFRKVKVGDLVIVTGKSLSVSRKYSMKTGVVTMVSTNGEVVEMDTGNVGHLFIPVEDITVIKRKVR